MASNIPHHTLGEESRRKVPELVPLSFPPDTQTAASSNSQAYAFPQAAASTFLHPAMSSTFNQTHTGISDGPEAMLQMPANSSIPSWVQTHQSLAPQPHESQSLVPFFAWQQSMWPQMLMDRSTALLPANSFSSPSFPLPYIPQAAPFPAWIQPPITKLETFPSATHPSQNLMPYMSHQAVQPAPTINLSPENPPLIPCRNSHFEKTSFATQFGIDHAQSILAAIPNQSILALSPSAKQDVIGSKSTTAMKPANSTSITSLPNNIPIPLLNRQLQFTQPPTQQSKDNQHSSFSNFNQIPIWSLPTPSVVATENLVTKSSCLGNSSFNSTRPLILTEMGQSSKPNNSDSTMPLLRPLHEPHQTPSTPLLSRALPQVRSSGQMAEENATNWKRSRIQVTSDSDKMWLHQNGLGRTKGHRYNLPLEAKSKLLDWLRHHVNNPYPTLAQKEELATSTGLSLAQVSVWFFNARCRYLPDLRNTLRPAFKGVNV